MSDSEFELIDRHFRDASFRHEGTVVSNGDDASVHSVPADCELVISIDTALMGRHWPEDFPLDCAADRAVGAALSDLAAMGAQARWLWLALTLTRATEAEPIGRGVRRAALRYGVEIAGGDTTRGQQTTISVTVGGWLPKGTAMRRDQARAGDAVYVCGHLGRSHLGLKAWQAGQHEGVYVNDFAHVQPLLAEGMALREAGVRCCMDISDGLLQDAGHICVASGCAMELDVAMSEDFSLLAGTHGAIAAAEAMYTGGDDYALLFTASSSLCLPESLAAVRIGQCVTATTHRVQATLNGQVWQTADRGYDHFALTPVQQQT